LRDVERRGGVIEPVPASGAGRSAQPERRAKRDRVANHHRDESIANRARARAGQDLHELFGRRESWKERVRAHGDGPASLSRADSREVFNFPVSAPPPELGGRSR
jgi:hypothetical protein